MYLPPEVANHVVSYLVTSVQKKKYPEDNDTASHFDWNAFIRCGKPRLSRVDGSKDQINTTLYSLVVDTRSLLSLRLVSHIWHAAATPVLRQHHIWSLQLDKAESPVKAFVASYLRAEKLAASLAWLVAKVEMAHKGDLTWVSFKKNYLWEPEEGEEEHI